MLQNWLKPINITDFQDIIDKYPELLLNHITVFDDSLPDLKNIDIALVGLDINTTNTVRKYLYKFNNIFNISVVDLGDVLKKKPSFYIPVITELIQSGIIPIIIGDDAPFLQAQFQAYKPLKQVINIVSIERDLSPDWKEILETKKSHLLHASILGHQSHVANKEILTTLETKDADLVRLGRIRQGIDEVEPIIRYADMISLNLNVMKQAEVPAQANPSPSGLHIEEACMLLRYAGLSDKTSSLGIQGFRLDKDIDGQTAQAIAQLIWYFMEGVANRKRDFPVSLDNMTEYIVDYKHYGYQLTFWRSNKSGRWWMQIPAKSEKEKTSRHRLIPCSYQDYQLASDGKVPDRLIKAFNRFG